MPEALRKSTHPASVSREIADTDQGPVTEAEVQRIERSMRDLLGSLPKSKQEAMAIERDVARLNAPAPRPWIAGRVVSLLGQYFVAEPESSVMVAIAADWDAELRGHPAWAIQRACRWWMSSENPNRRKRPLPGDIAERAGREMAIVRVAESALRRFYNPVKPVQREEAPASDAKPTPEHKARVQSIVDEFLKPRRVTGGGEA